jgi:hypothetical protein
MTYQFDAVRWCKSRARSASAQRNFADENSFVQVAREVAALRAELAALKTAVRAEREADSPEVWEAMSNGLPRLYMRHGEEYTDAVQEELERIHECAVEAVDALVGEG